MAIRIRIYPQAGSVGLRRRRQQQNLEQRIHRQQVRLERQQELLRRQQLQTSLVSAGYGTPGLGYGAAAYGGFGAGVYGASSLGGFPHASSWGMVAQSPWQSAMHGQGYLSPVAQVTPGYGYGSGYAQGYGSAQGSYDPYGSSYGAWGC